METLVGEYKGFKVYFLHGYSCPSLKLYGYATDLALYSGMRRELRKRAKITLDKGPGLL